MSETRAYALRESVEDFAGGQVSVGPDTPSLDVGAELEKGGGTIVTKDPAVIAALDIHPLLKRTAAKDAEAEPVGADPDTTEPEPRRIRGAKTNEGSTR